MTNRIPLGSILYGIPYRYSMTGEAITRPAEVVDNTDRGDGRITVQFVGTTDRLLVTSHSIRKQ